MFGTNKIYGKSAFKDMPPFTLKVTSMFYTLQGEGPFRGIPAFFIRLAHCNLACSFCDTMFETGTAMTFEEIEAKIEDTMQEYFNKHHGGYMPNFAGALVDQRGGPERSGVVLVITGGEPLLQNNLSEFLKRHTGRNQWRAVQIESNGIPTIEIPPQVVLVVSPKCAEKDGKPTQYLKPSKTTLARADYLKFVMNADDSSPYSSVPDWVFEWAANRGGDRVFLSPMNIYNAIPQKIKLVRQTKQESEVTMEERSTVDEVISFWEPGLLNMQANQRNHEYAARYAINHGFVFNVQLHLLASLA